MFSQASVFAKLWRERAPPLFDVRVPRAAAVEAIRAYSASVGLPARPAVTALDPGEVRFHAVALDASGSPVPVMNSDEGFALLFGEPDAKSQRPSSQAIAERLDWWAELFEPPCVGFATSLEEAHDFAASGADFVLVGDLVWADPRGPKAALIEADAVIKKGYAALPVGQG